MARVNYNIILGSVNSPPFFINVNVEEVEGERNLIERWTEQREARAAYFDYSSGRFLMHSVLGVFKNC
jgi:hypothetical protein